MVLRAAGRRCAFAALGLAVAVGTGAAPRALSGPEVVKLDWNTRGLVSGDFDGDGRTDLAVANNDRGRIELLLQLPPGQTAPAQRRPVRNRWEPVLDDGRFSREFVSSGGTVFDLVAADLDGDGDLDLAYTGQPVGLTVRLRGADGSYATRREYEVAGPLPTGGALQSADLDGDGRFDLVLLTLTELQVWRQTPAGQLTGPLSLALSEEGARALELVDVDGDGRLDLAYVQPGKRDGLRVRFQAADGGFGPEQALRLDQPPSPVAWLPRIDGGPARFAAVHGQTRSLLVHRVVRSGPAEDDGTSWLVTPRVYSHRTGAKQAAAYAVADFDGDGRPDVAATDPEGAQVVVFLQSVAGELDPPRRFPSFAEPRSLAAIDWEGDGRAELVVASAKEQAAGVIRFDPTGRASYPEPLPVPGRPQAVAAADWDRDGRAEVAVATEVDGKRRIHFLHPGRPGTEEPVELKESRGEVSWLQPVRDREGTWHLLVGLAFEPARLLLHRGGGRFAEATNVTGFQRGVLEAVGTSGLIEAPGLSDRGPSYLVGGTGFARALQFGPDGEVAVEGQFNARETQQEIQAAVAVDVDGDGVTEVLLSERRGDQVQLLRREADGVRRLAASATVGRIELVGALTADLAGRGVPRDVLLLGRDRFWWLAFGQPAWRLEEESSYETDLEGFRPAVVHPLRLSPDPPDQVVLYDGATSEMEFVERRPGPEGWTSWLHFEVFEADPRHQGRRSSGREPREALAADVTGDGATDLVLLVHDRILVYPQTDEQEAQP